MNLKIFCAIFCFPTTLAFQVSFHEMDLSVFVYQSQALFVCTPHQFVYQKGDNFTMYIQFKNASNKTDVFTVVKTFPGTHRIKTDQRQTIKLPLKTEQIRIDLEILTKDGCVRETILEGREMLANAPDKTYKNNDICLNKNHCMAIMNVEKECTNKKRQPCEVTSNQLPSSSTAPPLDNHDESLNDTYKMLAILDTSVLVATNILNSLESPTENVSSTSSSTVAETPYFTVMIVTSVTAAVALIFLLVIAIRHFCRRTYNSPGLPQIPANENRYYENILFRDECQKDMEQLEQRPREDRQPSELQYEQINNRW